MAAKHFPLIDLICVFSLLPGKVKGEIELQGYISSDPVNTMVRVVVGSIVIKIFKPAQVIKIGNIKEVISHDIEIKDRLSGFIGKSCPGSCIEEGISRSGRFGIISQVGPLLAGVIGQLNLQETIDDVVLFAFKIIPQF